VSKPIDTITPSPAAVTALGAWPAPKVARAETVKAAAPAPKPARVWHTGLCENRATIYRDNPKAYGGKELDRIEACFDPAVADRWVCRGTDRAEHLRYCQHHADKADAWDATARARIVAAYAARGEAPLVWSLWDRVLTPDGPGTVVFLPSAAWSDTYEVGLDSRRRGDRSSSYLPHQLTTL
jgi:hypothetical protein